MLKTQGGKASNSLCSSVSIPSFLYVWSFVVGVFFFLLLDTFLDSF